MAATTEKQLVFPKFDDIKVSTKTFIAMTNLIIDLKKLFEFLPITDYTVIPKKRGRKKKDEIIEPINYIDHGSIVTLKHENKIRGVDLKQKKSQKKKKSKWFRNSFTVVIMLNNKPVNFKVCQNGMFQITGIKQDEQAEDCVKFIWNHIKYEENNIYKFSRNFGALEALFIPAMRNIDFSLGFNIDREKLSRYMSIQTEFHSLLETSFGYTGVNIKLPLGIDIKTMKIKKLIFTDDKCNIIDTFYSEYLQHLSEKDQNKKINKVRYNSLLCFHSGKVILSSINAEYARDSYYNFLKIIRVCKNEIEEKLDI